MCPRSHNHFEQSDNGDHTESPERKPQRNGKGSKTVQTPLETYLREINETPLLTAKQEKELGFQIEDGDSNAKDHMVRANLRFAAKLARSYIGMGLGLQDLIEEGNLGLIRAAEKFDPRWNIRFCSYAGYWINQFIKMAIKTQVRTIYIPPRMGALVAKWQSRKAAMRDEFGREPADDEIAQSLGIRAKRLPCIQKVLHVHANGVAHDGEEMSLEEVVADDSNEEMFARFDRAEQHARMLEQLAHLDKRQEKVIRMRFGLDDEKPKTLKEIGENLGLTRERIRQIQKEALSKLAGGMNVDPSSVRAPSRVSLLKGGTNGVGEHNSTRETVAEVLRRA